MTVEPLRWPEDVVHPTGWQKFLMSGPWVGPGMRAYRAFRAQVAARPEECLALWKPDARTLEVRDRIFGILKEHMEWKVLTFIPDDPCDILFKRLGDVPDEHGANAWTEIRYLYGSPAGLLRPQRGTLGELVERIAARKIAPEDAAPDTPSPADRDARDRMADAVRAYMNGEITAFDLDDALAAATDDTRDKTADAAKLLLWDHYGDVGDARVAASRKDWDALNRLRLLLESDVVLQLVTGPRRWTLRNAIAAAALAWFAYLAEQTGWGWMLVAVAMPFGIVSMALAGWRSWEKKRRQAFAPFPSAESLGDARRRVAGFEDAPFPPDLRERKRKSWFSRTDMDDVSLGILWLILSPVVLAFQAWPRREHIVSIVNPPAAGSSFVPPDWAARPSEPNRPEA
jgi:hypothetical protein